MKTQSIKKYYQQKAIKYKVPDRRLNNILDLMNGFSYKRILDLGCSTGYLGRILKTRENKVYGIDISEQAILKASKILDHVLVVDLTIGKIPFPKNFFDLIVCSEVLEHLFQPVNVLKECRRVLKPGGQLIVTTPNLLYWGHRINFLKGKFEYQKEGPFDEGHIHFYTYQTLLRDLKMTGLKITKSNNIYLGNNLLNLVKNRFPGLFAYQFVILAEKEMN